MVEESTTDILIIGAGPIGLAMAIQLKSQGFNHFRIIDADDEPGEEIVTSVSRAIGIHARTVEILEDLNIADKLIDRGTIAHTASNFYNSKLTYRVNYPSGCDDSHVRYPWNLMVTQGNTIDVLHKHLSENLNTKVEWNKSLSTFSQDNNHVVATLTNHKTGSQEIVKARYMIGCDGCHSAVRKGLDIGFPGHSDPVKWVVCDLDIDWDIPHDDITFLSIKDAYSIALPLAGGGEGRFRVTMAKPLTDDDINHPTEHAAPMRDEKFTKEDCVNFFKNIYPSATVRSTPTEPQNWFQIHWRFAEKFRKNRCFLVGDAAHIHSPILGQGMNMGIQDATNLAWKLVAVCRGNSSPELLDTYETERVYADKEVVYFVDKITKLVITRSKIFQYLRGFILSRILKTLKGRRKLISKVMQLSIHYKGSSSPLIEDHWNSKDKKGSGFEPGERIPDPIYLNTENSKTHLFQTINGNFWNALIFVGLKDSKETIKKSIDAFNQIKAEYSGLITPYVVVTKREQRQYIDNIYCIDDKQETLHTVFGAQKAGIYLLRPDRYIGYRESGFEEFNTYIKNIFPRREKCKTLSEARHTQGEVVYE